MNIAAADVPCELGWIVVAERHQHQGHSKCLIEAAIEAVGDKPVFATAKTDNPNIHNSMVGRGFAQIGLPYPVEMKEPKSQFS
ncbi:hypothetical protein [Mesorhizobium captivum]|uniref:hypothetical protein n=1 Tax=Mesorhizobium captivum TaxID=3072319 RepID=UPI002A243FF0|nr:hypothetical protein [Mesorhizobium sp. VK3C]MDX8449626.1 hypothetical protein [Mesorhizobium sp. VK3C]